MRKRITHVAMAAVVMMGAALGSAVPMGAAETAPFKGASCAEPSVVATTPVAFRPLKGGTQAPATARRAAQITRNDKADVTFELRQADKGGVEVTGASGDLLLKKTVQANGEFVLELSTPRDAVAFAVNGHETSAARGKTRVRMPRTAAGATEEVKARRLLADSEAVLKLRGLAAALIEADDRSPSSLSVIMADALVGALTGDVGAPRRIAKFLARNPGAGARPAAMAVDCFTVMETRMTEAFTDYAACWTSVSYFPYFQQACAVRWIVQAESYWFSFISCTGFNW